MNASFLEFYMMRVGVVVVVLALPLMAGCSSSEGTLGATTTDLQITGDERGGQIPRAIGGGKNQAAYDLLGAHCAKYNRKGAITKMDFESGTLTFQCLQQSAKPSS